MVKSGHRKPLFLLQDFFDDHTVRPVVETELISLITFKQFDTTINCGLSRSASRDKASETVRDSSTFRSVK
jgi:hypothetical protein